MNNVDVTRERLVFFYQPPLRELLDRAIELTLGKYSVACLQAFCECDDVGEYETLRLCFVKEYAEPLGIDIGKLYKTSAGAFEYSGQEYTMQL